MRPCRRRDYLIEYQRAAVAADDAHVVHDAIEVIARIVRESRDIAFAVLIQDARWIAPEVDALALHWHIRVEVNDVGEVRPCDAPYLVIVLVIDNDVMRRATPSTMMSFTKWQCAAVIKRVLADCVSRATDDRVPELLGYLCAVISVVTMVSALRRRRAATAVQQQ
jgi:hypothetical protein